MFSGAVGQIYCRHPLGLTAVRQGGAPVSASRTIVAVAVHTSCSTQNACEFVLVSRAQSHHANTLVGLLALTRFFTSVRLSDPGLGSWPTGSHGNTGCAARPPGFIIPALRSCAAAPIPRRSTRRAGAAQAHMRRSARHVSCSHCTLRGGQSLVVRTGLPPSSMSAQAHLGAAHHLHPCLVPVGPLVHKTRHLHECCSSRKGRIVTPLQDDLPLGLTASLSITPIPAAASLQHAVGDPLREACDVQHDFSLQVVAVHFSPDCLPTSTSLSSMLFSWCLMSSTISLSGASHSQRPGTPHAPNAPTDLHRPYVLTTSLHRTSP